MCQRFAIATMGQRSIKEYFDQFYSVSNALFLLHNRNNKMKATLAKDLLQILVTYR